MRWRVENSRRPQCHQRDCGQPQQAPVAVIVQVAAEVEPLPGGLLHVSRRCGCRLPCWGTAAASTGLGLRLGLRFGYILECAFELGLGLGIEVCSGLGLCLGLD